MEEKITVKRGWHCTIIENHVINSDISCHAKMVYVVLCMYADRCDKTCYPSLKTICKDTSIKSKNTVKKGIDELRNKGFLEIINRKNDKGFNESNLYIIKDYPVSFNGVYQEMTPPISGDDPEVYQEMTPPISGDDPELKPINESQENKNQKNYIYEQVESIWKLYPKKMGRGKATPKIEKLINQYGFEQLSRCIDRYKQEIKSKRIAEQYIQYGSTFFNNGYIDYLDKNYNLNTGKTSRVCYLEE